MNFGDPLRDMLHRPLAVSDGRVLPLFSIVCHGPWPVLDRKTRAVRWARFPTRLLAGRRATCDPFHQALQRVAAMIGLRWPFELLPQ